MANYPTNSGLIEINGANLYYEITGSGPPLLLIHAGVADSRMWADQIEAFAQHYRVIRYDLRGFGRSNLPAGSFANWEDVRTLLTAFDISETYLLGISFGGLIALDFTLAYPQMVKGLILGAPSVSGDTPSERIKQFWAEEEALLEAGDLAAATDLNVRLWVDGPHRRPEQVNPAVRDLVRQMQLRAFQIEVPSDIEEQALIPPAIERLAEVKTPTLLLVGDLDLPEKLEMVDKLVSELPHARKVVLPGVAHMLNMEQPAQFNQIVLEFLAEYELRS
jgi:pimeloyl-ACP methyl ester carboxylesterase